jgi:hypothetical protein
MIDRAAVMSVGLGGFSPAQHLNPAG